MSRNNWLRLGMSQYLWFMITWYFFLSISLRFNRLTNVSRKLRHANSTKAANTMKKHKIMNTSKAVAYPTYLKNCCKMLMESQIRKEFDITYTLPYPWYFLYLRFTFPSKSNCYNCQNRCCSKSSSCRNLSPFFCFC